MHRRLMASLFVTLLLSSIFLSAYGETSIMGEEQLSNEEKRVLAAEDEYIAAELHRDEGALNRLVDDRFQFNLTQGTTADKAMLIESVLDMKMSGQTLSERSVLIEGKVALIFGTTELRSLDENGDEIKHLYRYTSTLVNRDGNWRYLALQMTPRSGEE